MVHRKCEIRSRIVTGKSLHIVSFDVPFPPSYGGVIDVFFKIKALHDLGVKIHLHCFDYGRGIQPELQKYCEKVTYYNRSLSILSFCSSLPFIVKTRMSKDLLDNISDGTPVLMEGLHCCGWIDDDQLQNSRKIVRTHNIEHEYYHALGTIEKKWLKRMFFFSEAAKLKRFEKKLAHADAVLAISPADAAALDSRYKNVKHVMAFHPNTNVTCAEGKGKFALYHGNLEVGENNQAALYLVNEVFHKSAVKLVIAGKNPSEELRNAVSENANVELMADITTEEIDQLIETAHVNVLPTFQATGIKLKLLTALFRGRFCVVNTPMIENTGLEKLCVVKDDPLTMRQCIEELFNVDFTETEIRKREEILAKGFSNLENAEIILGLI
ncbi:MAG: hypothetical protein Fur0041_02570 [Bacteroidia bacterium]